MNAGWSCTDRILLPQRHGERRVIASNYLPCSQHLSVEYLVVFSGDRRPWVLPSSAAFSEVVYRRRSS
jgi:hypothetical protein